MAEKKGQHFVPKFHLRNFNPRTDGQEVKSIAAFNLKRKRHILLASIAGQCQRDYIYSKDLSIEDSIKVIEDRAALVISNIIKTSIRPKIGSDEYFHLLNFLTLQKSRTVAAGKMLEEMYTMMARFALKMQEPRLKKEIGEEKYEEMAKKGLGIDKFRMKIKHPELESIRNGQNEAPVLADLCMKVLVNKTDVEFITSDSPVVLFNQWCQEWQLGGNEGYASSGLQIFFPISNHHTIVFYDNMVYVAKKGDQAIDITSLDDIQAINSLQLLSADENLYYSGDLRTKEMIDKLPLHLHKPPEEAFTYQRSVAVDMKPGKRAELLVTNSRPNDLRLDLSFMKIQKPMKKIPLDKRARQYRKPAFVAARLIDGHLNHRELPSDSPRRFIGVEYL